MKLVLGILGILRSHSVKKFTVFGGFFLIAFIYFESSKEV